MKLLRWLGQFAPLVAIAIAWGYDWSLGVRVTGFCLVLLGAFWLRAGEVGYGWEGRERSGTLTGLPAVLCALIVMALGVVLLVAPQVALPVICGSHQQCP